MDTEEEIRNLQKQINELTARRDLLKNPPPSVEVCTVAEELHRTLCRKNHTDGCSWFDRNKPEDWNRDYTKQEYVAKAEELLSSAEVMGVYTQDLLNAFIRIYKAQHKLVYQGGKSNVTNL